MSEHVAAAKLNELMTKQGITPKYEIVDEKSLNGTHQNTFVMRVISPIACGGPTYMVEGSGRSKKEAKHKAAFNFMQKYLREHLVDQNKAPPIEVRATVNNSPFACAVNVTNCNRHSVLQTLCLKYKWGKPEFSEVDVTGPPHSRRFTARCNVSNFSTDGTGTTKSEAKLNATTKMIQCLMQEAEVYEIFESPRLTITEDSQEMICLSESLKSSQHPTPIGIFGRRISSSSSSDNHSAKDLSIPCVESSILRGNINTSSIIIGLSNNCKKGDDIAERSDDSALNISLIDFDDTYQPQRLGNSKHKSKSLNNLSESDKDLSCVKAVKKIETTFENVEKQLHNAILDTLENRELPRQKTVVILSHEYKVCIDHESSPKIFEGNQKCTDPSIRIACLTKLLMDMQSYVESNRKNLNK